jgi:putative addiction module component (TIGR02574 family)
MTPKTILQEALRLPIEDRLTLVEQIWDSIAADSAQVPVPDWHKAELDRRMADPTPERLTWDEVQKRLHEPE